MSKIVIPVYKHSELLDQLFTDLYNHEKSNIESVYVVDDFSQDGGLDLCIEAWSAHLPIVTVRTKENVGFTIASNSGLAVAVLESENPLTPIYLISSDVRITGKFIERTNVLLDDETLVGHKLLSRDTGWNRFEHKIFPYLEGYFLVATAKAWADLDYFDEHYAPYDFEDVDLSTKAISKGYKLIPTNNPNIKHLGGKSIGYSMERSNITMFNKDYFKRKWIDGTK